MARDGNGTMNVDPIHQFQIHDMMPMMTLAGREIAFTNSALFMMIIVVGVSALMLSLIHISEPTRPY